MNEENDARASGARDQTPEQARAGQPPATGSGAEAAAEKTAPSTDDRSPTAGAFARLVAAGILLSRLAGLVRERIFAQYFGTSIAADAFKTALRAPNVLQNLLGEGTLSASFIPVYADLLEKGKTEEAGRVAGAIFSLLVALAGIMTLLGVLFAPVLVSVFSPGFEGERRELTIAAVRIIFPMTGVLVLSAWALGVLNSHRRFFLAYFAPVLWNAAIIATLLWFGPRQSQSDLVTTVAWGALVGGVLQFLIQLPRVLRLERSLKIRWNTRLEGVRTAVRNAVPAVMGRGVVQLSGYLDLILASFLAAGAPAALMYANTIYILPISLFGMSVAAAELPELSRKREAAKDALRTRVSGGLRQIAVFVVPSLVAFLLIGDLLVGALYQTGDFGRDDTLLVWAVLAAYSIGLMASTATRLYSSTFFALQDTKTPAKYATVRVLLAAGMGAGLMLVGQRFEIAGHPMGPVGIATGAGIAAWIEFLLLRRSLRRQLDGDIGVGGRTLAILLASALVAAAVARGVDWLLPPMHPILLAALIVAPFGIVYFGMARLLGVPEAKSATDRILRRLGR